ncbi:C4-dicarboxylate ABC transporter substrate-binding protein [Roseibium salinum]|nr:C4-dicarboxylate ABC transporter substrate-binding protein [Roseibium salinum]
MTDGRISITLTANGSVVPARETPEAVAAGVLDGDFTSVNYFSGLEPAYAIMGDLISGYDTPEQMLGFCKDGGGEAVMQKAADSITGGEVHVVACGPYSREALPARVPIRTFEDLEGKKIRSPEGLAAAVFQAAGASPVSIPFFRGVRRSGKGHRRCGRRIGLREQRCHRPSRCCALPALPGHPLHAVDAVHHQQGKKWDALSEADRTALRDWWYEAMYAMVAEVSKKKDKELAERDAAGEKVTVIDWAQEDRDQLREVARSQWEVFAQKSELAQEALEANIKYMTEIGLFKN